MMQLNILLLLVAFYKFFYREMGKKTHFYSKMVLPHAISRCHSNRLSSNFAKMFSKINEQLLKKGHELTRNAFKKIRENLVGEVEAEDSSFICTFVRELSRVK